MSFPRSGTVDTQTITGTKDFVMARASAVQNANIAANDHLKFDTIDLARGGVGDVQGTGAKAGAAINLDTTTTYSNTNGAASLGRFSLQGGKTYRLTCSPGYVLFSGATGVLVLQFFDVTGTPAAIGQMVSVYTQADASQDGTGGMLQAMYQPGGSSQDIALVEVRILSVTALTQVGAANKGFPTVFVETY